MSLVGVVVVAAGRGTRMGTAVSKQYLPLAGKPVLVHTLEAFEAMPFVSTVVLVVGAGEQEQCEAYVKEYGLSKVSSVLSGGPERQSSVYRGLKALGTDIEWVMVHDGVRPFITERDANACLAGAKEHGAAVLAVPVKDTVKIVAPGGCIESTPNRSSLWAIHTPQAFHLRELIEAHEQAEREGFLGTDDAMLAERAGQPVYVVEGSYGNIKITTPEDLEWAEFRMKQGRGE